MPGQTTHISSWFHTGKTKTKTPLHPQVNWGSISQVLGTTVPHTCVTHMAGPRYAVEMPWALLLVPVTASPAGLLPLSLRHPVTHTHTLWIPKFSHELVPFGFLPLFSVSGDLNVPFCSQRMLIYKQAIRRKRRKGRGKEAKEKNIVRNVRSVISTRS